jgi:hypothetical protein
VLVNAGLIAVTWNVDGELDTNWPMPTTTLRVALMFDAPQVAVEPQLCAVTEPPTPPEIVQSAPDCSGRAMFEGCEFAPVSM